MFCATILRRTATGRLRRMIARWRAVVGRWSVTRPPGLTLIARYGALEIVFDQAWSQCGEMKVIPWPLSDRQPFGQETGTCTVRSRDRRGLPTLTGHVTAGVAALASLASRTNRA